MNELIDGFNLKGAAWALGVMHSEKGRNGAREELAYVSAIPRLVVLCFNSITMGTA